MDDDWGYPCDLVNHHISKNNPNHNPNNTWIFPEINHPLLEYPHDYGNHHMYKNISYILGFVWKKEYLVFHPSNHRWGTPWILWKPSTCEWTLDPVDHPLLRLGVLSTPNGEFGTPHDYARWSSAGWAASRQASCAPRASAMSQAPDLSPEVPEVFWGYPELSSSMIRNFSIIIDYYD